MPIPEISRLSPSLGGPRKIAAILGKRQVEVTTDGGGEKVGCTLFPTPRLLEPAVCPSRRRRVAVPHPDGNVSSQKPLYPAGKTGSSRKSKARPCGAMAETRRR